MNPRPLHRLLLLVPLALAAWLCVDVIGTWLARLPYPYDLEWMEGGVLAHAWRLQQGLGIYVEPSPEFIPMIYPPGYPSLLAALGAITGLGHPLGRFVSGLSTLFAAGAIVRICRTQLDAPRMGFLGAAAFLATYHSSGAFMDLVRPDALQMALLTWAIALGMEGERKTDLTAAGLLFLAFTVKHNAAAFGVPIAIGILARSGWRDALRFGLAAAIPGLLFTGMMEWLTEGRFLAYILEVPGSHPVVWDRVSPGAIREVGHAMPIAVTVCAAWTVWVSARATRGLPAWLMVVLPLAAAWLFMGSLSEMPVVNGIPRPTWFEAMAAYGWLGMSFASGFLVLIGFGLAERVSWRWVYAAGVAGMAVVVAGVMRGHHGGFVNVFMILHWVLALGLAAALAYFRREQPGAFGSAVVAFTATAHLGWAIQNLDTSVLIPTDEDYAAGDEIVAWLEQAEGPVLSPFAPWIPAQAGHAPSFHLIALWDIRHPEGPFRDGVKVINAAIHDRHWATIVDARETMQFGVRRYYKEAKAFEHRGRALMPRTGWRRRPGVMLTPSD